MMNKPFVAILMGSDSDLPVMEASFEILKKFDIPFEVKVTSAHRTPAATHSFVTDADHVAVRPLFVPRAWQPT